MPTSSRSADQPRFDYSNLSGRPSGPVVVAASRLLPGVRSVQAQVAPFAAAWEQQNRSALDGDPALPVWFALGDSMTQGIGAPDFWRGWVGQAADRLAAAGDRYRVVNLAVSGGRVSDVLARQLPAMDALCIQGVSPALVTVLIGSNDLVRRRYREQLPTIFAELLARLPIGTVGTVIANLPNPRAAAHEMNRQIQQAVRERGLRLADMRTPQTTGWRGKLAADHFHPNELGYTGIADAFYRAIEAARNAEPA